MKLTKTKLKQIIKEELKEMVEPFSSEEQEAHSDAYYELFDFLQNSSLPGDKPSEKLHSALRWIAKFEEGPKDPPGNVPPGSETWSWDDWKAGSGLPWKPTIK